MTLDNQQTHRIAEILRFSVKNKLKNYSPEPNSMPFHSRLLGSDRLALYSFIHSLSTNFGTTIFEPIGIELGQVRFRNVQKQSSAGKVISAGAQNVIQQIMNDLTTSTKDPNKAVEIERLRSVAQLGDMVPVKLTKVDLMLESHDGTFYLFDLKTAKPNAGDFKGFKRTLLEWTAAILAEKPDAHIQTAIAIPYNPYAPNPYERWTIRGMLDLTSELVVAERFWDFVGGEGTYEALLDIFEAVGIELRPEIDDRFSKFR